MVARIPALSAIAALLATGVGCASLRAGRVAAPSVAGRGVVDSLAAPPGLPPAEPAAAIAPLVPALDEPLVPLHEEISEESVDAETLWALDQLLADPVDLNRGALARLLALPWLSSAHVAAIRQARPLEAITALARLPGWDAALVRRTAPFVRLGTHRDASSASLHARTAGAHPVFTFGLESRTFEVGLRSARDSLALDGGFVRADVRALRLVIGDVGVSHGQGLLWWSSQSAIRATSAALRRPRGVLGVDGGGRTHALRGAAAGITTRRVQIAGAAGDGRSGHTVGAAATLALGRGQAMHAAWLQAARSRWSSVGWSVESATSQAALEIVPSGGNPAVAIAAETRWGRTRLGARYQRTPPQPLAPLAGVAAGERGREARHALLQGSRRWGRSTWELALVHGARHDTLGGRVVHSEQRLSGRWSWSQHGFEMRLRQRRTRIHALEVESTPSASVERQRGVVVRSVRAFGSGTSVGVDYRAEEQLQSTGVASGTAWQVHVAHTLRPLEAQVALTSFAAPTASAAPVVPEPGAGGASRRLVGDGMRAVLAVRLRTAVLDCGVRAARSFGAATDRGLEWAAAVGLQLP